MATKERIGVMRAPTRNVERMFNPVAKRRIAEAQAEEESIVSADRRQRQAPQRFRQRVQNQSSGTATIAIAAALLTFLHTPIPLNAEIDSIYRCITVLQA